MSKSTPTTLRINHYPEDQRLQSILLLRSTFKEMGLKEAGHLLRDVIDWGSATFEHPTAPTEDALLYLRKNGIGIEIISSSPQKVLKVWLKEVPPGQSTYREILSPDDATVAEGVLSISTDEMDFIFPVSNILFVTTEVQ